MSSEMPERTPDARAANKEIVQPKRQKEQQGSPAQDDGLYRERCLAQAGEKRARHRGAKKRYRSTRRTLKRRKDPPQAHLGAPTPDSVARSHKLKCQCLSKGLHPQGQYLRSKKVNSEGKQKLVESALRSHLTKTQLRRANLKRFSNAEEETPQRNW